MMRLDAPYKLREHMEFAHPRADAVPSYVPGDEIARTRRLIAERQLCGLANNTKWNRLITEMRQRDGWTPSYRFKCIDGDPSRWDVEWWCHLPFPFITVEWFDIGFLQQEIPKGILLAAGIKDHSNWIDSLLDDIGFEYLKGEDFFRLFGYSPRNMELFEE